MTRFTHTWIARGDDRGVEIRGTLKDGGEVVVNLHPDTEGCPSLGEIRVFWPAGCFDAAIKPRALSVPLAAIYAELATAEPLALSIAGFETLTAPRPGRRGHPERLYALWAARYVERYRVSSRRPVLDLAEAHGVPAAVIRRYLFRARERGLLLGARWGAAGGHLSERALAILRDPSPARAAHADRGSEESPAN